MHRAVGAMFAPLGVVFQLRRYRHFGSGQARLIRALSSINPRSVRRSHKCADHAEYAFFNYRVPFAAWSIMRVSPEEGLQRHAAEGRVSRDRRRTSVGSALALLLVALTASRAMPAAIYQCTGADGQAVFSDSPCGPDSRRLEVEAPAPSRAPSASRSTRISTPPPFSAAGQSRLEAFVIRCSTSDFNRWVQAQHPMPDWDVRRAKLIELTNSCRRAVHLPDLVSQPSPPTSPQRHAQPPRDAVFAQIVKQGSVSRLQAYLQSGNVDVNDRSDLDKGLLDHAAEQNQVEIARFLIEHGAKVDASQTRGVDRGMAPLHRAAAADAVGVASLLIAGGATVNQHGPLGITPLIIAASHGNARTAEVLLDHGADISTATGDKKTALSEATAHHHPDMVHMLLLHVPTPTMRTLGTLAMNADVDAIRLLMRHDSLAHDIDVISKNTALRYAIVGGQWDNKVPEREQIIDLLIAAGADVDNRVDSAPNTPLMMVTSPALADFLIKRGANLNAVGWYGTAANQLACNAQVQDRLGMFKVLLAHRADITTAVKNGRNGLQCALTSNRPELVAFLRSQGVPVDAPGVLASGSGAPMARRPLPLPVMTPSRNIRRGDRDYPAVNVQARQAIAIHGKAPADWTVRLYVYYTTKTMFDKNSPGEVCQYDASGGLEGAMQPYSVQEDLPVTRQGDTFTATLFFDHFEPGRCGWHVSDLGYSTGRNDGNPPTAGILADSPRNHPGSPDNGDRMDLWCWEGPVPIGIANSKFDCTFAPYSSISPIKFIPLSERGNIRTLLILPTTRSLIFIFHDLDAEAAAFRSRVPGGR